MSFEVEEWIGKEKIVIAIDCGTTQGVCATFETQNQPFILFSHQWVV
jgi:hypothetical protein